MAHFLSVLHFFLNWTEDFINEIELLNETFALFVDDQRLLGYGVAQHHRYIVVRVECVRRSLF